MQQDKSEFFLHLARRKDPLVPYASERGETYLVNNPSLAQKVLRDTEMFKPSMHPFRELTKYFSSTGNTLLRFSRDFGSFADGFMRTRVVAQRYCSKRMDVRNMDGRSFYLGLKEMSFLIAADILFEFDATRLSKGVGAASDIVEDTRARCGLAGISKLPPGAAAEYSKALSVLADVAVLIQLTRGQSPQDTITHAIIETMLNAFVPISYALIWSLLLLGSRPSMQETIVSQSRADPATEAKSQRFVDHVVHEALRLFPPAWLLGRSTESATSLDGSQLLPGQHLTICPYALQRAPTSWTQPHRFDPNRFVQQEIVPYAYLPFGGGARFCPAARYVPSILSVMIQVILGEFSITTKRFPKPLGLVALRPGPELDLSIEARMSKPLGPEHCHRD